MLRQALQGRAAGRVGAGVAVRAEPARLCGLSALRSGDSPGAIEPCAARPVWPGDQRGRAGQHSFRQPEALRGADEPDQGAADGRHGAGLGRNRHEGRQGELVAVGVPSSRQRRLCRRQPSLQGGCGGLPGRLAPDYWISDRYGGQMGWAKREHQVCLAHLIRTSNTPSTPATRCSPQA